MTDLSPIPTSTLLMGPPGTGKTTSLITILEAGLELFVLITDPNGVESLLDACRVSGTPLDKLHYCHVMPGSIDFSTLITMATTVTTNSYEEITKKKTGLGKENYIQFTNILRALHNFKCERTGEEFGDITTWGPNRFLVIDSLSGLNTVCLQHVMGNKPAGHPGEYGIARQLESRLLAKLLGDLSCFFVLIAHISREIDAVTQSVIITPKGVTGAYGTDIGKDFSDVVLARRDGTNFYWSTIASGVDLKGRALELKNNLPPDFRPIIEVATTRAGQIQQQEKLTNVQN